jgi:hypothetical protein
MKNCITNQEMMGERRREIVNTTLGDLVITLTDEVRPYIRDPSRMYLAVSRILTDLLARRLVFAPWLARTDTEGVSNERKRKEKAPRFH